jgi:hypothetical protein
MIPEMEWALDRLASAVTVQPDAHPLRRVDRDNSEIYGGPGTVDMTQPIRERVEPLKKSNLVAIRSASADDEPQGQEYALDRDIVLSVRIEGLIHSEYGHIDPRGDEGVVFDALCKTIRNALLVERTYPDHPAFDDARLSTRITNQDHQSAAWADFYRREFDVVVRHRTLPPSAVAGFGVAFGRGFGTS